MVSSPPSNAEQNCPAPRPPRKKLRHTPVPPPDVPRKLPPHLPSHTSYHRSYMHKASVTHLATTATIIIVAAEDGTITLWSRDITSNSTLSFIKSFRAHNGPLSAMHLASDTLVTLSSIDNSIKLFSVSTFDMRDFRVLPFPPVSSICVVQTNSAQKSIVIPLQTGPVVAVLPLHDIAARHTVLTLPHTNHLTHMAYNQSFQAVISIDAASVIQYWRLPSSLPTQDETAVSTQIPSVSFTSKLSTHLFELARQRTKPTSLSLSRDGTSFAVTATDRQIRVFSFRTGKLFATLDESLVAITTAASVSSSPLSTISSQEFGRRMARERQVDAHTPAFSRANVTFDESGTFLIYTTVIGIKILHIPTCTVSIILGARESAERFLSVTCCDTLVTDSGDVLPPLLIASSFDSQRIFLFSREEPTMTARDVFNERPVQRGLSHAIINNTTEPAPRRATLHTTEGDIGFVFTSNRTPKTIENFCTHARNKYYDGVVFHRVIKGFMIQTGDPSGNGTGGQSIWGGEFEDELDDRLSHETGTVSMANAGKRTNGSQFFITCQPAPHLDGKHTIFGKVVKGMGVVKQIESTRTDKYDRPVRQIRIESISIHMQ